MTFSPYQHVPGTPALNIFSLSSKQGEILCSTPEQSVPRTPCTVVNQSVCCKNENNPTPLLTPNWTPLSHVSNAFASPNQSSTVEETLAFTSRLSQKASSSCLRKMRLKKYTAKKDGQTIGDALFDFHIVPDIAWIEEKTTDVDEVKNVKNKLPPSNSSQNDCDTDDATLLEEDIWG